jgi:hypothetical protein
LFFIVIKQVRLVNGNNRIDAGSFGCNQVLVEQVFTGFWLGSQYDDHLSNIGSQGFIVARKSRTGKDRGTLYERSNYAFTHLGVIAGFFPDNLVTTGNITKILPEKTVINDAIVFALNGKIAAKTTDDQSI